MSSMRGLPPRGSDVTVLITRVHIHPLCEFAEFWGRFSEERNADYRWLAKDIQSTRNIFHDNEGIPGDQCLVQVGHTWHRSRIVSRTGSYYRVFLIDKGEQCLVANNKMAWGKKEHFHLPPEVEFCVLANVLPHSPETRWSPTALEFLRTLSDKSVRAHVQCVLVSQRTVLLHIPCISKQMCEMGFAKRLSAESFHDVVFESLLSNSKHPVHSETPRYLMSDLRGADEQLDKQQMFMYPDLELGTVERVIITEVINPQQVFCQLNVLSFALKKLSEQMTQCYEDGVASCDVSDMVGFPCAARGSDGKWYRSVLQHVFQADKVVKVLAVDSGRKQFVRSENLRPLAPEFLRMPVVTYMCSLNGIIDKGVRWTATQIDCLRRLLLHKTVSAKFESQNVSEGVHYVTLYDDENKNLNYLFGSVEKCLQAEPQMSLSSHTSNIEHSDRAHGHAVAITETHRQTRAKMTIQPAITCATQNPGATPSVLHRGSGHIFQVKNTFKEQMFPIGSDLDVTVSCTESPNDFWCQLAQRGGHLKSLMYEMQSHYEDSEYEPFAETACVARHPDNGMWYRALVTHTHEVPRVDVLFVDYGQKGTVSRYDLRRILPEFQTLEGQAFRCSLLNPINASSVINDWGEEAIAKFNEFVDTATSKYFVLKCTIYAVTYSEQNIVFNVVDLATPFETVCTQMVNLIINVPPKKASGPSLRLDTFYYSTHNVKTGTEEKVTVTSVNSVSLFYCQLEKNADVVKDLHRNVNNLCHQLEKIKVPTVFGTLCFAKYRDGHWYRAQFKATEPSILVHFVDYGNTIEVSKSDVFPIPKEATDIMSVPVQAVKCGLAGIPDNVSREVNGWFESNVTECKFRALVVAREPNGKLLVELYLGNIQLNSRIKKMFNIHISEEPVVFCGRKAHRSSGNHEPKIGFPKQATHMEDHMQKATDESSSCKPASHLKDEDKSAELNVQFGPKTFHKGNGWKVKAGTLKLYTPPHLRQLSGRTPTDMGNNFGPAVTHVKPTELSNSPDSKRLTKSKLPSTESQKKSYMTPEARIEELPKLTDLPSKTITPGMETDVFVSHCNSPLSFCVQFVREKDEIISLVDKLNEGQTTLHIADIKDLHPGDLVQAEFPDDSSWYRAVVREIHDNMTLVEFVDFGNTSLIPITKIQRLQIDFLELSPYSTHCMLSKAAGLRKDKLLDPDVVSAFKNTIGDDAEKNLKCRFVRRSGSVWEVDLEDSGVDVMCEGDTDPIVCNEIWLEKLEQETKTLVQDSDITQPSESSKAARLNVASLRYHERDLLVGQHLEAYVACFNSDLSFSCQSANSEELDKITPSVSEVGNAADSIPMDGSSLLPGSPCVALYTEDKLWYRAQVISKDEEKLSVLFVDYGEASQVNVRDVRQIRPDLLETPPQAFLCELEGFDASHGSWDSGAVDKLSALTTDKLLQLTVLRVTRKEGKIKYFVEMECEGQVINDTMKTCWGSSKTESNPDEAALCASRPCDSSVEQTAVPAAQPPEEQEDHKIEEIDAYIACTHSEGNQEEEQCAEDLTHPDTTNQALDGTSSLQNSDCFEKDVQHDSFADVQKEEMNNTHKAVGGAADTISYSEQLKDAETSDSEQQEFTTSTPNEDVEDGAFVEELYLPADNSFDQLEVADTSASVQLELTTLLTAWKKHVEHGVFGEAVSMPTDACFDQLKVAETAAIEQLELTTSAQHKDAEDKEVPMPTEDRWDLFKDAETSGGEQLELTTSTPNKDVEVGVFIEELFLPTDDGFDQFKVAETSASEQLKLRTSTQKKEAEDCVFAEEALADDSFELLLSMVSHLTLTVVDGLEDICPLQQLKESLD